VNLKLGIAALALAAALAPAWSPASDDLLARMAALNPQLHSYTASMHADVHLKTFPFVSATLEGTIYHKDPGMNKLVISSGLPMMAEQFNKLYANIPEPGEWSALYTVSVAADDGKTRTFSLVPKKKSNVDRIDAKVDEKSATIVFMRWNYDNGGFAEMNNRYKDVKGNTVVGWQTAHVEEPGYTADISSTLDNYSINPALSDDLFSQ
jgi:outer membrane lipoprotein-sorting protein